MTQCLPPGCDHVLKSQEEHRSACVLYTYTTFFFLFNANLRTSQGYVEDGEVAKSNRKA